MSFIKSTTKPEATRKLRETYSKTTRKKLNTKVMPNLKFFISTYKPEQMINKRWEPVQGEDGKNVMQSVGYPNQYFYVYKRVL